MSATTYIRAVASTLPLIGPIISPTNLYIAERKVVSIQNQYLSDGVAASFRKALAKDLQHGLKCRIEQKFIAAYKDARLYAAAGFVGNIVSLIWRVRLYTLGILPHIGAAPVFAGMAIVHAYKFYQYQTRLQSFERHEQSPA